MTSGGSVTLALTGGRVWSGVPSTAKPDQPAATALAIEGGRVAWVGSDDEVRNGSRAGTRTIDLHGRWVGPGFIDAHTHFIDGGLQLGALDLRGVDSREEFTRRVGAAADQTAPDAWITGGNWDEQRWGGRLPSRHWLDAVSPKRPVYLVRSDLHMAVANSAALQRAGVTATTPDPPGGHIDRGPEGLPTGVVRDRAMPLIACAIPEPDEGALDAALDRAVAHALSVGVTQVHDMGQWAHFETYRRMLRGGRLGVRVYSAVQMPDLDRLLDVVGAEGHGGGRLWWGGLKAFVDGSLGSATAWFHEPYADAPDSCGLVVTDLDDLRHRIGRVFAASLQPIVHAIGDRANDWLLDVYTEFSRPDCRPRIEHAQHLSVGAAGRFFGAGAIASVQPAHVADDGPWAEQRIGAERIPRTYAFRSLLDAGARVAFGSDWTVAPLDPRIGLEMAVRRRVGGDARSEVWVPDQRIEAEQALVAYTAAAAYAGGSERSTGRLVPGWCADAVVLSSNPFDWLSGRGERPEVELTLVDGEIAYDRRQEV